MNDDKIALETDCGALESYALVTYFKISENFQVHACAWRKFTPKSIDIGSHRAAFIFQPAPNNHTHTFHGRIYAVR